MHEDQQNTVTATEALVRKYFDLKTLALPDGNMVALVPEGMTVTPLKPLMDPYRTKPERRRGTATMLDQASFVAFVNRYADADSAIFATHDQEKPGYTAIFDYHHAGPDGEPRFGVHRAVYNPKLDEAWSAWARVDKQPMDQAAFAKFLIDRKDDVCAPPSAASTKPEDVTMREMIADFGTSAALADKGKLLLLSRELRIRETAEAVNANNVNTGETEMLFHTKHTAAGSGDQPLLIPVGFLLAIPVFDRGPRYVVMVRLTYRLKDGKVSWTMERYRPEKIFRHAFDEMEAQILEGTAIRSVPLPGTDGSEDPAPKTTRLPVYRGSPEAG